MAHDLACRLEDLIRDQSLRAGIKPEAYVSEEVGLPTINDILAELAKPGRDPRESFEVFSFAEGVHTLEDLQVGMRLPGVVTNVTNFGAFVDVGVHNDGLVHISQLADHFVRDPRQEVKVHQTVEVVVIGLDLGRGRVSLSMKSDPFADLTGRESGDGQGRPRSKGKGSRPPRRPQGQRPEPPSPLTTPSAGPSRS